MQLGSLQILIRGADPPVVVLSIATSTILIIAFLKSAHLERVANSSALIVTVYSQYCANRFSANHLLRAIINY